MISQPELIERWSNAGRVLAEMPEHERQNHWDMGTWGKKTDCGTIACAAGHCGLDPWFREHGFKTVFPKGSREARMPNVPDFFGVEGSSRIFYNAHQRPVETVIDEVRSYIAELQRRVDLENRSGLPRIGEEWTEQGGIFAGARIGIAGAPDYFLIVGPEHDGRLDWPDATNWAGRLALAGHSDFGLPRCAEGLALFDGVRSLFKPECYWLAEQRAERSGFAWFQHFSDGHQRDWYKHDKLRCRAVRRLEI